VGDSAQCSVHGAQCLVLVKVFVKISGSQETSHFNQLCCVWCVIVTSVSGGNNSVVTPLSAFPKFNTKLFSMEPQAQRDNEASQFSLELWLAQLQFSKLFTMVGLASSLFSTSEKWVSDAMRLRLFSSNRGPSGASLQRGTSRVGVKSAGK